MLPRIIEGLMWSAAGFVGGFSLAWLLVRAPWVAQEEKVTYTVASRRSEAIRIVIGLTLLFMVALTGVRYYQTTSCQTEYNARVAESLAQRSEAQRQQTAAQIELLTASLGTDRDAAIRETLEYIEASRELERVRAASPIPQPPDCGDFR